MDLNLLQLFKKVAISGSITKASRLLNVPKSKISRDIVKLEQELMQTLLIRSPRGVILTEQGQVLLQSVSDQLDEIESSIDRLKENDDQIKGKVKLTAPEDLSYFLLISIITEFMEEYPEVEVELYSANAFLDFNKYQIDLALRVGKLEDSSLIQKKISDVDVPLIASKEYLKSRPKIKRLEDLKFHKVATMRDLYGSSHNKEIEKFIKPSFSTNSIPSLIKYIEKNKGIATVPRFLLNEQLRTKNFEIVFDNFKTSKRSIFLLTRPSKHTPKHVKIFKDYLFNKLKSLF